MRLKIDRNSYGTVLMIYFFSALAVFLMFFFLDMPLLTWPLTALLLANLVLSRA